MMVRRERDSNPRSAQTDNGFQDRRNRPLCHLSGSDKNIIFFNPGDYLFKKNPEMLKKKPLYGCFFESYFRI
jgi:hypothetical protein